MSTEKSPRRVVGETLLELAKSVRNRMYHARRGAVNWASFDFAAHPRGIAIVFDECGLFPSRQSMFELKCTLEMFVKFDGEDSLDSLDDALMDEIHEDARWIIEQLVAQLSSEGDAVAIGVPTVGITAIETHDADLRVQGLIVPFTVSA